MLLSVGLFIAVFFSMQAYWFLHWASVIAVIYCLIICVLAVGLSDLSSLKLSFYMPSLQAKSASEVWVDLPAVSLKEVYCCFVLKEIIEVFVELPRNQLLSHSCSHTHTHTHTQAHTHTYSHTHTHTSSHTHTHTHTHSHTHTLSLMITSRPRIVS